MISNRLKFFLKVLLFVLVGWLLCNLFPAFLGIVDVQAMTVNGQNVGSQTWSVTPTTDHWYVNKSIDHYWSNWGSGYIYFNIGISKRSTDSVTPLVSPKSIVLTSGNQNFACSIGTNSVNNSTYVNQNYSVVCPVNLTSSGLTMLTINLMPLNNTPIDTYEIYFDGFMSFVNDSSNVNVSVDDSSSNSNRDSNFGNLITDNRNNTNSIIQNNDDNTNKITGSVDKNTEEQKKTNEILKDSTIDDKININENALTDESGIQDLLLMPLTLMNAVNTGFNSSCSSFSLGSLFGHDLSLKCFTISDVIGSNLSGIIDVIISGIFIYLFSKHLRKVFDRTTNLENEEGDVI